jgi:small-conductance mechanosensitive channel
VQPFEGFVEASDQAPFGPGEGNELREAECEHGDQGLIVHTTVGIGYETPWRQVEAMLKEAASRTGGLLDKPPPFVLQQELGDFAVTYEINAHRNDANNMAQI